MLYGAGAGHCLIGTIAHSKEPAEAANVPVIGDVETLDFEKLLALQPTGRRGGRGCRAARAH
jgi:ABC-type hemin transport system substrate-binding protein